MGQLYIARGNLVAGCAHGQKHEMMKDKVIAGNWIRDDRSVECVSFVNGAEEDYITRRETHVNVYFTEHMQRCSGRQRRRHERKKRAYAHGRVLPVPVSIQSTRKT